MKFKLKDVLPNPYRNLEAYPINRDKVEELKESIGSTEFWDNLLARPHGEGQAQIAYGHHRLVTLQELYSPEHEINLILREMSEAEMLQIMFRENSETYHTEVPVLLESIRAVVSAYAAGNVALAPVDVKVPARYVRIAPSFIANSSNSTTSAGNVPAHAYTAQNLADFLGTVTGGEPTKSLYTAIDALELIELGVLDEKEVIHADNSGLALKVGYLKKRLEEQREVERKKAAELAEQESKAAGLAAGEIDRAAAHAAEVAKRRQQEEESAEQARKYAAEKRKKLADETAKKAAERLEKNKQWQADEKRLEEQKKKEREQAEKEAKQKSEALTELRTKHLEELKDTAKQPAHKKADKKTAPKTRVEKLSAEAYSRVSRDTVRELNTLLTDDILGVNLAKLISSRANDSEGMGLKVVQSLRKLSDVALKTAAQIEAL